jgi:hypothetical protein
VTAARPGWRHGSPFHLAGMLLVLLLALLLAPRALGHRTAADEYALKAAFLFNFTRFVEWPAHAFEGDASPFRICVFGTDPFRERLDALDMRTVGPRPIELQRPASDTTLRECHIAYLAADTPASVRAQARAATAPTTLTVSSDTTLLDEGGMIALVTEQGRVRLHVNLATVRESPLRVSAKLLEVAVVHPARSRP